MTKDSDSPCHVFCHLLTPRFHLVAQPAHLPSQPIYILNSRKEEERQGRHAVIPLGLFQRVVFSRFCFYPVSQNEDMTLLAARGRAAMSSPESSRTEGKRRAGIGRQPKVSATPFSNGFCVGKIS